MFRSLQDQRAWDDLGPQPKLMKMRKKLKKRPRPEIDRGKSDVKKTKAAVVTGHQKSARKTVEPVAELRDAPAETFVKHAFDSEKNERVYLKLGFYKKKKSQQRVPGQNKAKKVSEFVGVYWNHAKELWEAKATLWTKQAGKSRFFFIGYYETDLEAAVAYDEFCARAVKKLCGVNFPERYGGDIDPTIVRMKSVETDMPIEDVAAKMADDNILGKGDADSPTPEIEFDFGF